MHNLIVSIIVLRLQDKLPSANAHNTQKNKWGRGHNEISPHDTLFIADIYSQKLVLSSFIVSWTAAHYKKTHL